MRARIAAATFYLAKPSFCRMCASVVAGVLVERMEIRCACCLPVAKTCSDGASRVSGAIGLKVKPSSGVVAVLMSDRLLQTACSKERAHLFRQRPWSRRLQPRIRPGPAHRAGGALLHCGITPELDNGGRCDSSFTLASEFKFGPPWGTVDLISQNIFFAIRSQQPGEFSEGDKSQSQQTSPPIHLFQMGLCHTGIGLESHSARKQERQ